MVIGDSQAWRSRFVTVDERLLRRISAHWPQCMALLQDQDQPHEDTITENLVNLIYNDEVVRQLGCVEYQYYPFAHLPTGAVYSTGQIDMALILDQDRERYIAYECKRLNVRHKGRKSSLATDYVKDGVMRFVTEKYYSDRLPIGCMLGYVMDGDISFALKKLRKRISEHKSALRLVSGPTDAAPVHSIKRFLTTHRRPSMTIEVRHALLAFPGTGTPN